jgi:hypothetical protein
VWEWFRLIVGRKKVTDWDLFVREINGSVGWDPGSRRGERGGDGCLGECSERAKE